MSDDLRLELKKNILKVIHEDEVDPESLPNDQPLFELGLELDSIDILELVVQVEKQYGVTIKDEDDYESVLRTIDSLAEFIETRSPKA